MAVVEDQRMMRELLAAVLTKEPGISVVGQAASGAQAIRMVRECAPNVVLLDVGLSDMSGIAVARVLRQAGDAVKLIALSVHSEPRVVDRMLRAGAMGYVLKSAATYEIIEAIRAVADGKVYLSPAVADARRHAAVFAEPPVSVLGQREREVLARLAEGKRSAEIAAELRISLATVEVHRRNIMSKLGLHSIAELTKYAIRKGLTEL
ncbi:MAG TPA: response regulator transcription factor [Burkholderiales bacterium]|nr:response regulator transcription factor [Burkholderiales bacterium]